MCADATASKLIRTEYTREDVPSWQDALKRDTRPVPKSFFYQNRVDYGVAPIPVERYTSAEQHRLEVQKLWPKVWQLAAFEDDLPRVGDYLTYEIAERSIVITRAAPDKFAAFYNACLHRAAELVQGCGHAAGFVCPFHGWAYGLDGALKHVPQAQDFPQICAGRDRIRPIRIESYNGILYINMDPDAEPLLDYLGRLPEFLANFPIKGRRQRVAWVQKKIHGNWKNVVEAFQEGYHLPITHHQFAKTYPGFENEVDVISKNVTRLTGPGTMPNCITGPNLTEQQVLDLALEGLVGMHLPKMKVPEGGTARSVMAELTRQMLKQQTGLDTSKVSDVELIDHELFHVFPNSCIWGSWSLPIVYRWRPNGGDHASTLMEIFMFVVHPEGATIPPPAPLKQLGFDEPFGSAPELGAFGPAIDQDCENMVLQKRGLASTPEPGLHYSRLQESLLRHFNQLLDERLKA